MKANRTKRTEIIRVGRIDEDISANQLREVLSLRDELITKAAEYEMHKINRIKLNVSFEAINFKR